eukprot:169783_1
MALSAEETQVEGGQNTVDGAVYDNFVPAASAPFNPAADAQSAAIVKPAVPQPNDDRKQHPLHGWWWKLLIVLFVLFTMVLFIVWIGPTYIWGDTASAASNSAQSKETTHAPTLHPLLSPTLQPTARPTAQPTTRPTVRNPTQSPSFPTTLRPTMRPTKCPTAEDTYVDDETCLIAVVTSESCTNVDMGSRYEYDMDPFGCTQSVSCIEYSKCFNQTHVADDGSIYERSYTPYSAGQAVSCIVTRSCEYGECEACSKSSRYNCIVSVFGVLVFSILALS